MRTLVIGDIHGYATTLRAMLKIIRPRPDDVVITLGDYVDRGPDSRGVLNTLIELADATRLIPLRGNHDQMMLDVRHDPDSMDIWLNFGGRATVASYGYPDATIESVGEAHWRFLSEKCVDWYETESHIFVHAHLDPERTLAEQDVKILHWSHIPPCHAHRSGKTIICGHSAVPDGVPLNLGHTICIDTIGGVGGWLTCLDVEAEKVVQVDRWGNSRIVDLPEVTAM